MFSSAAVSAQINFWSVVLLVLEISLWLRKRPNPCKSQVDAGRPSWAVLFRCQAFAHGSIIFWRPQQVGVGETAKRIVRGAGSSSPKRPWPTCAMSL